MANQDYDQTFTSFMQALDDLRIVRVRRASSFYFWSIKHSKIMFVSANSMKTEKKCNLCIPKYRPGTYKKCNFRFSTLNSFKRHIMSCEFKFKRPLMWATKNEIPTTGLKREREIGDLRTLQNAEIMRVDFRTKSIIKSPREMVRYFRKNGCHCKDELGQKCNVRLGATFLSMFYHLAHLERERKDYMVFKATPAELSNYESHQEDAPDINLRAKCAKKCESMPKDRSQISTASNQLFRSSNPYLTSIRFSDGSISPLGTTIYFSDPPKISRSIHSAISFNKTVTSATSELDRRNSINSKTILVRTMTNNSLQDNDSLQPKTSMISSLSCVNDAAYINDLQLGSKIRTRMQSRMYCDKKTALNVDTSIVDDSNFHSMKADFVRSSFIHENIIHINTVED